MINPPSQRPLRVVLTQPCLPRYRVPIFRALAERPGIDLTVVYAAEKGITNAEPDGFKGVFSPMREIAVRGGLIRVHPAQYQYAHRSKADVLVLSWSTRYATLLPALVRAAMNSVGTVLWGHGFSKSETPLRRKARAALGDLADCLLFYNHAGAHGHAATGGSSDRTFVALNALDQTGIHAQRAHWLGDPARLAEFRAKNDLNGPVLLFVSRLYKENRVDMLLDAAAALRAEHPALTLAIVGTGPDEAELRAHAERRGLKETVRFLGALYGEELIAPWFMAADVFVYPANIGLSVLHAFGYGVPVITSDRREAQNPEIEALQDGKNGLLYRDGDAQDLIAKVRIALSERALRDRLATSALATASTEFTLTRMIDGFEAAIRYAAARKRITP
jgi:glycosyltransferase involved in cell wall biosynthesis